MDKVKTWWDSYHFTITPSFVLAYKLKALKYDLKKWNANEFGDIDVQMKQATLDLQTLDLEAKHRPLTYEEQIHKDSLLSDLERLVLFSEISWRQKSKALWLTEGDKNTKFLHQIANSHRKANTIGQLDIDGETTSDQDIIREHISQFYEWLYTESSFQRPVLDGLPLDTLSIEDAAWIERPFEEEEVFNVVRVLTGIKPPVLMGILQVFSRIVGVF